MKLDKAIELNTELLQEGKLDYLPDHRDAIQLGAEALKAVIDARANSYWTPIPPLPGETPEDNPQKSLVPA